MATDFDNEREARSNARAAQRTALAAIEPRIKARTASLPDLCEAVELLMKLSGLAMP